MSRDSIVDAVTKGPGNMQLAAKQRAHLNPENREIRLP
jgi:hypothetical protein